VTTLLDERYRLERPLGRGGMGAVYQGRDLASGREVAVKLFAGRPDPRRLERFRREGEATAALSHPGIVRIHASGETDGRPYLVYELVESARTLDEAFVALDLRGRVELVRDAARALGYAHARGVVHRDVKPANLLVDRDGRLRVADFGLALARETERLTRTGALLGTPSHMAPELLSGAPAKDRPPVDVWSLGVVLYQAITGELPFESQGWVELAAKISAGAVAPPSARDPSTPAVLEGICLRALQVDPGRRYPDGDALADALDAFLAGRAVDARPRARRPPAWAGAAAAALAAAAFVGAAGWWAVRGGAAPAAPSPAPAPRASATATAESAGARAARLERAREASLRLDRLLVLEELAERRDGLARWLAEAPAHPRRAEAEAAYRDVRARLPLHELALEGSGPVGECVGRFAAGRRALVVTDSGAAQVWDLSGPSPAEIARLELSLPDVADVVVLPDGDALFDGRRALCRSSLAPGAAPRRWELGEPAVDALAVGAAGAGTWLALGRAGAVEVYRLDGSWPPERDLELGPFPGEFPGLAASGDGRRLAALVRVTGGASDELRVWEVASGREVAVRRVPPPHALACGPRGDVVVVGALSGRVLLYDVRGGDEPVELVSDVLLGEEDLPFRCAHGRSLEAVAFSPDGRLLYSLAEHRQGGGDLAVWDVATGEERRRVRLERYARSLAVSPAGDRLLLGTTSGVAEVWRAGE